MKFFTSSDIQMEIARYLRSQRRAQKLSRDALAERSTVPAPTIKRFELTGEISFRQLCLLWETLDDLGRLKALCDVETMPKSIEEVLADAKVRR
ncbi:transcriptional regulator [Litorivicinus sp.]|jgi:transcriptional regulator with XRE-family HTH domain|nr:transcriptional regulator [Litorivicinus sp.]